MSAIAGTMDKTQIQQITTERLDSWRDILIEHHSTPAVLIAIGHDQVSGELHLCTTDDMPQATLRGFLVWAIRELDGMAP